MITPRVVLATGHMVDLPDRATPRFPADQVPRVTGEVRDALAAWQVGPGSTVVCGGARGADLIVAEEALARGARILLCLALPREEFIRRSVDIPGTDWAARFERIAGLAEIRVLGDANGGGRHDVFARANAWMVDVAPVVRSPPARDRRVGRPAWGWFRRDGRHGPAARCAGPGLARPGHQPHPPHLDEKFPSRSVVVGDQRSCNRLAGGAVEPDRGGQGEQSLGDPGPDPGQGPPAVQFQVELALEGCR